MAADRTSHRLNHQELAAIECPLQLKQKPPSASADDGANRYGNLIDRLGGPSRLSSLLCTKDPNRPVELQLIKSDINHFIRPVAGEFVKTSNILVKVIKRTRKPTNPPPPPPAPGTSVITDAQLVQPTRRIYKIEPVGVIPLTVRFRTLADYQYTPDLKHPINNLARDMRSLNVEGILKFRFEAETEDYSSSSKIALFPPPLFSRYLVPQLYNYRQNLPSVITDTPDGYQRLVNKSKYVPLAPQSITFDQPQVPQGPTSSDLIKKKSTDESVYRQVEALFEQRPMWIRVAFQNQLSPRHVRLLRQNREILVLSCYTFADGPFKDFLIKFKYDPRVDPEARFYQRISLRNLDKTDASEKFTFKLLKRPAQKGVTYGDPDSSSLNQRRDHIFDGVELHQSVGTYQLCDITDPLLTSLINSTKGVLPKCHVRTGWYTSNAIEQIRSILRKKFHALLNEQRVIKDIECVDLLEIDISQDAVDLVKKSSVTEKRSQAHHKFFAPGETQDQDVDESNPASADQPTRKSSPPRPLHPNPLLKYRREKNRIKAKPADKSVTFFDPDDHNEDVEMADANSDPTSQQKTVEETTSVPTATAIMAGPSNMREMEPDDDDDEFSSDDEEDEDEDDMEEEEEGEEEEDGVEDRVVDPQSSDLSELSED